MIHNLYIDLQKVVRHNENLLLNFFLPRVVNFSLLIFEFFSRFQKLADRARGFFNGRCLTKMSK